MTASKYPTPLRRRYSYTRLSEEKANRVRATIRVCLQRGLIPAEPHAVQRKGVQVKLAEHFGVSRQRIH